jgi:hypothetical protein
MAFGRDYLGVQTLPQGLKPPTSFAGQAARLKPCPFKTVELALRLKPCPFKAVHFSGVA